MEHELNLRIPGPIPVDDEILTSMSSQMINHRGPEYKELLYSVTDRLKKVFETTSEVFILTASGTGGMEAAIVNTLSPADKVINASCGSFGERFGSIASIYGADVIELKFPYGKAIDLDHLRKTLQENPDTKAVTVTHNETSTGVVNNIEKISEVVKGEFESLLLVDGVSSVSSIPVRTDEWNCDVVATASQKGWGVPPGLAFFNFSSDAWEAHKNSTMPRYYFDVSMYQSYYKIGQPPFTPALSVMFAMDLALEKMTTNGMGSIFEHHSNIAKMTREGIKNLGLSLFPDESVASDTVTAINLPEHISWSELNSTMLNEHNVVLAGGQGSLAGKIFRIGHLGDTPTIEIEETLDSLEKALKKLGFKKN